MTGFQNPVTPLLDQCAGIVDPDRSFCLVIICDHRKWLQLLADEWWVPGPQESGFRLGVERPLQVDCEDKIAVAVAIDPESLPDLPVQVARGHAWRTCRLREVERADDALLWTAPVPLNAVISFTVATENDRVRLSAMSKGFANLAVFEQPLAAAPSEARSDTLSWPAPTPTLRPPPDWNAMRGAAAMALWSVPSTPPWLETLCGALSLQSRRSVEADAIWWIEPPWASATRQGEPARDLALWRAIVSVLLTQRLREGWNRRNLLTDIVDRAAGELGARGPFAELETETSMLLRDQKAIDVAYGDGDPLGLALQLVLLRPTADRFETWKKDLPGMQPVVWLTGATLAGLVTGYRDLEPRFTGLPSARHWIAVRTWQLCVPLPERISWPHAVDADPCWKVEESSILICADSIVLAHRKQNNRGRWYLSDLQDKAVKAAAIDLAQAVSPSLLRSVVRIRDHVSPWLGDGMARIDDGKLIVEGEITLPVSESLVIDRDLDEQGFRTWLACGAIAVRLPAPPEPKPATAIPAPLPRQASLLDEAEDGGGTLPSSVPGLVAVPEFVSPEEERLLVDAVDGSPWIEELTRRVQHYGWRYDYKARKLDSKGYLGPLPEWARQLAQRLVERGLATELPDQVIVNEYVGKQGISAHVDCVSCFRGPIITISLLESWEMVFCHSATHEKKPVMLERCSAIVMGGDARHLWTHEIRRRLKEKWGKRQRRISLTFRKVDVPPGP